MVYLIVHLHEPLLVGFVVSCLGWCLTFCAWWCVVGSFCLGLRVFVLFGVVIDCYFDFSVGVDCVLCVVLVVCACKLWVCIC